MTDVFRTLVVPAAVAPLARRLAAALHPGGVGMFRTPVTNAAGRVTHFASSGWIDADFAAAWDTATGLEAACQRLSIPVTRTEAGALLLARVLSAGSREAEVDGRTQVVSEGPRELLARLGLSLR